MILGRDRGTSSLSTTGIGKLAVMVNRRETEIKIPVAELESVRRTLRSAGASCIHDVCREVNTLFDSPDGVLGDAGSVLRVRRYGQRNVVTFKGPATFKGTIKDREEIEVVVDSAEHIAAILERTGFRAITRYEKDRELWAVDGVVVSLDHTPMGDFVEVEGPSEHLPGVLGTIGLDGAAGVTASYPQLWVEYRERNRDRDLPRDMVFPG